MPLLLAAVLAVVIVALSAAAYLEARRSALAVAEARLTRVNRQLAHTLEAGVEQVRAQAATMAAESALRAYLRAPGIATEADALSALTYQGANPSQIAAIQLVDRAGRPLLDTGVHADRIALMAARGAAIGAPDRDTTIVGPLTELGDSAVYAVTSPVRGAGRRAAVTIWRYLVTSEASRAQTAELIGSQATLYLGNASGDVWTDLAQLVPAPPLDLARASTPVEYRRGDSTQVALALPIGGTPWVALLEFSRGAVLGPLRAFMARLALIAVLLLGAGLGAGWLASLRITRPLRELTEAAEAMHREDYSRRVRADRHDELGSLAHSFNRAAERVQESQARLEEKVAERTRALREAQDELVRRERLAMLGLLASGLSHELRNPLGVMTNAVYYLDGVLVQPPAHVKRYLRILQEQIARAEKIVGDLIDFALVEPPDRQPVTAESLVERALERLAVPSTVRVERDFAPYLPRAYVDPAQVSQVIENLLTNAVQAMGAERGVLTVRAAPHDHTYVRIEIADTGPGIPADRLERIFEPLYTTKTQGIGLGLAVSRTLAAANDARITVTSQEGNGATFTLILPAHQEAVAA